MANLERNGLTLWLQERLCEERALVEQQHLELLREFAAQQRQIDAQCETISMQKADEGFTLSKEQEERQDWHPKIHEKSTECKKEVIFSSADQGERSAGTEGARSATTTKTDLNSPAPSAWVKSWKELKMDTFIGQLVTSQSFEIVFAVIIFLNVVVMVLESQYTGLRVGQNIGYPKYAEGGKHTWQGMGDVFELMDTIFGILYTVEVLMKIIGMKCAFLQVWNMVDLLVVILFYLETIARVSFPFNTNILRLFRLAKILRLLRLVHELAGLEHLLVMVVAVKGSLTMLLWTSVLLIFILSLFAFVLNQLLVEYAVESEGLPMEVRRKCFEYFGTFSRSIFSMFELTLANLTPISRFLIEDLSEFFIIFTLAYKLTLGFSVVGVLNACFIKQTFKILGSNKHIRVIEKKSEKKNFQKEMNSFIKHADISHDGKLDQAEFIRVFKDDNVEDWMESHGLAASDSKKLFQLMDDDGSGEVEAAKVVKQVAALKGPATSLGLAIYRNEQLAFQREIHQQLKIIDQSFLEVQATRQRPEMEHPFPKESETISAV